jgi:hypothetical protein
MELKSTSFPGSTRTNVHGVAPVCFQLGDAIDIAASRSGLSHKQLCAHMDGLDQGTWSKQRDGDGHVSLGRLLKCPPEFWREFLPLLAEHYGMGLSNSNGISQSIARCLVSMADVIGRLELAADRKAG